MSKFKLLKYDYPIVILELKYKTFGIVWTSSQQNYGNIVHYHNQLRDIANYYSGNDFNVHYPSLEVYWRRFDIKNGSYFEGEYRRKLRKELKPLRLKPFPSKPER